MSKRKGMQRTEASNGLTGVLTKDQMNILHNALGLLIQMQGDKPDEKIIALQSMIAKAKQIVVYG